MNDNQKAAYADQIKSAVVAPNQGFVHLEKYYDAYFRIDPEQSIGKFMGDPPRRYEAAKGPAKLEGCIFEIDPETGRCLSAEGIRLT